MPSTDFLLEQDLINNPTARVPVCLCLDTSGSMSGEPIKELNLGVNQLYKELMADEVARYSAEICTVTFGDTAKCVEDFAALERQSMNASFSAYGGTPLGEALTIAMEKLENRKALYRKTGVDYFQPWLVIMTDGQPNGDPGILENAIRKTAQMQASKKLVIFPIGIGDEADMNVLQRISPARRPLKLNGLKFVSFFQWLSQSVSRVSQSMPGEEVKLDTSGISDWATL